MLWAVSCFDNPSADLVRKKHMQPHRHYLDSRKDVLVVAGAMLTDDGQQPTGSLFIINVNSREEAKAFSDGDPFTQAGVFAPCRSLVCASRNGILKRRTTPRPTNPRYG